MILEFQVNDDINGGKNETIHAQKPIRDPMSIVKLYVKVCVGFPWRDMAFVLLVGLGVIV